MNKQEDGKGKIQRTTVAYFIKLLRETGIPKLVLGAAIALSIISSLIGLIVPLITGDLIDNFSVDKLNVTSIAALAGIFVLEAITGGISYYMLAFVGNRMVNKLRKRLWDKVLSLPVPFFDQYRSADTMSRVTNDTNEIKTLITDHLITFFSNVLTVLGAVAILFFIDWQMTLVILLAVPLGFGILMPIGGKMYKISISMYEQLANLASLLTQVISEIRLVKASNAESKEQSGGYEKMDNLFRFGMKEAKINAVLGPLMSMVMVALLVVIIGYGGVRVSSGALSAGELVSFILLLFQIMFPFSQFATFYSQLQKVMGVTERLRLILEYQSESDDAGVPAPGEQRDLNFRDVSFAYLDNEPVLRGVTFTVPANQITALVGPSGSGKTTVFSLIERFYVPTGGMIAYGDDAIRSFDLDSWRNKIGYVSQDSTLMSGTIRENMIYACGTDVKEEDMIEASKQAYAHEFIKTLPKGYDTEVGERGIQLSGGQRQRIAIARALLRQPDLLILDEATASLDSDSEHEVQKALNHLMNDRTTIVIAHRLSTVVEADRIIVLEHGRVTGIGKHEQLLQTHPSYIEWARKQFQAGAG
ncbi:ABC transporter ATP-binding protein [Paenibacillus sp. LHD-117]|uniref:ABC transporter ATP-binding protein n=1 Tax=Paenibacillus sp. LHD-117 TaxID=3071412 RepID=UPI0027E2105C|nr:ABC transporter ATP-binding protein [Paenibacillus sp. LHD-117]MDQ6422679.1 ABC transporter ATP-binding protein [Paenibacillus sp. LHD-117]